MSSPNIGPVSARSDVVDSTVTRWAGDPLIYCREVACLSQFDPCLAFQQRAFLIKPDVSISNHLLLPEFPN